MSTENRILPCGQQSFEVIRQEGMLYVDKTELVWQLARQRGYFFLIRPRRFGKSLLVDTLACYFEGKRELFEGLKIMELEKEWTAYPVIRLDMSGGGESAEQLNSFFNNLFARYEKRYGATSLEGSSLTDRFRNIITAAAASTGQKVVILIDEYDFPLQHTWRTPEHEKCTSIYRSVFTVLKSQSVNIRFVFITGITKFTQISLFSVLNNLNNISFDPEFATLCGMTRPEIEETFGEELDKLAAENEWDREETLARMKDYYDGYHFSRRNMVDVYNPYSVVMALNKSDIQNYWVSSGATMMLPRFVSNFQYRIDDFETKGVKRNTLESSDVKAGEDALFLYQCGYLTIKGFDADRSLYRLGYPNTEVREALYSMVIPALESMKHDDIDETMGCLREGFLICDMDEARDALRAIIADVPYSNMSLQAMKMEERYRFIISAALKANGMLVDVEHMMATGRPDIVAKNRNYTYVIELKLTKEGGIEAAERQIVKGMYAEPFKGEGRQVVAIAIELDDDGKGLIGLKRVAVE